MKAEGDDILQFVKQGRSAQLDWLGENAALETIASVLTAMANTQGGMLVLGMVGPAAATTGVRDTDSVVDRILQAALAIDPALIIPMPRVLRTQERAFVVVRVPSGLPHVYAYDGRFLQRQGYENASLKPRDLRRLMIQRGEASFETEITHGASVDDLDWDKAKAYVASLSGISETQVEKVLLKRGCLVMQDGRVRPTNAGILLFGKDPLRFVRGAEIVAARFSGVEMGDHFERIDITGSLPDQLRRAETFLIDHLRKGVQLGKAMARDEQFEYPLEAARELVVNAVAHRDYTIAGDSIHLFIFKDRMEVTSPGGLPGPVTIANIRSERFSRNPVIVQVLSDMGFIERLGYGVDRVMALMEERQLRPPSFVEMSGGFGVTLHNEKPATSAATDETIEEKPAIELKGEFRGKPINPRQETALVYLLSGSSRITNSDLQQMHPDVHPETIRRDLSDLVSKSILRKLGEKRGSYYVLRSET
ncbi:MAG: transcriptional regulator [Anaerolineae bacterium]|nr:transcriptional regulator [Anaerolineae bacterium]